MRPLKLKMTAFGAYVKPVELDFEKGLGDNKFFLIHGATGAGKTTILDAICYALYGESSGGSRTGKMMRSEQAAPTDKTEVEFTFALRGKIYRIKRNPKYTRARLRGDGTTEEKASAEIFEDGRFIYAKDVTAYVKNLLQFDCDQFRQVVLLPQGEFKKFLLASSKEKQEVLNMLFNAEFFKRVEDELKIKAADAKKTFETLTERKENLLNDADCPEGELKLRIKMFTAELDGAQEQINKLEKDFNVAQKNYSDGESISKLFRDLEIKIRILNDAEEFLRKILGELSVAQKEFDKRQAEESLREELKLKSAELGKKQIALRNLQTEQEKLKTAVKNAEKYSSEVERLLKFKRTCDKTMAGIKSDELKLLDAPPKLEIARQKLKDAQNREKLLQEIKNLRGEIELAEKNLLSAQKTHEEAEKRLESLRELQKSGSAAHLAKNLVEGEPCPVCGSIHHPTPAKSDSIIPTDAQIKVSESKLKTLSDKKDSAAGYLAGLKSKLETKEKDLSKFAEALKVTDIQSEVDKLVLDVKSLETLRLRIKNGDAKILETEKALEQAREQEKTFSAKEKTLRGAVDNMIKEIDAKYLENPELLSAEITSTQKKLDELNFAFKKAQENYNQLEKSAAAQKSTVESAKKNKSEVAAQVEGKTLPDLHALKKFRDETQAAHISAVESKAKLSARLERLTDIDKKITAINGDLKVADKNFSMWGTLYEVASGKTSKISFQRYYLSTMFKEVILEANNRLEKMSGGRYRFQNKKEVTDGRIRSAGLDLEIVDDFSGTARPVETLSGGESFLASLSLALGLAAVVQNNSGGIKLDTIFIDEGFGTLDTETLDFAMKTLMELQSGGRLVGIISHVEELKNQMPVRLEVRKTKTGSTAKFER